VGRVQVETAEGETLEVEPVDPGDPFDQRYFLVAVGDLHPTKVVQRAADGWLVASVTL
jgi:hypothetical protein